MGLSINIMFYKTKYALIDSFDNNYKVLFWTNWKIYTAQQNLAQIKILSALNEKQVWGS